MESNHLARTFFFLVLLGGLAFGVWAYTPPGSVPPGGTVEEPLNVGSTDQTKTGPLTVQGDVTANRLCLAGKCITNWNEASPGFTKVYGGVSNYSDWGESVTSTQDGGFVVAGVTSMAGALPGSALWAIKLQADGTFVKDLKRNLWGWQFGPTGGDVATEHVLVTERASDRALMLAAKVRTVSSATTERIVIWVYDSTLTTQLAAVGIEDPDPGGYNFYLSDAKAVVDGGGNPDGYMLAGSFLNPPGLALNTYIALKLDSGLNITAGVPQNPGNAERARALIQTADNGYLLGGNMLGRTSTGGFLLKLHNNLTQDWLRVSSDPTFVPTLQEVFSVAETSGGYVLTDNLGGGGAGSAEARIRKVNALGAQQWATQVPVPTEYTPVPIYGAPGYTFALRGVAEGGDGSYVAAGAVHYGFYSNASISTSNEMGLLFRVQSNGTLPSQRAYGGRFQDEFYDIVALPGGYVAVGYTDSLGRGAQYAQNMFIVKAAEDLNSNMSWLAW